jgi:FkbM family methyltransferase
VLIPVIDLVKNYNILPKAVLHIGAHLGEESSDYNAYFNTPVIWIEAQPNLCKKLKRDLAKDINLIIEACIFDEDNKLMSFNLSTNSQSSSLLKFGTHLSKYPDIKVTETFTIKTKRLDTIFAHKRIPDFINLDIQGVELRALKSLGLMIDQVKFIYTEVNKGFVYKNCDQIQDIDRYLKLKGFHRLATRWVIEGGWGDALYVRRGHKRRNLIQIFHCCISWIIFYLRQIKNILEKYCRKILNVI